MPVDLANPDVRHAYYFNTRIVTGLIARNRRVFDVDISVVIKTKKRINSSWYYFTRGIYQDRNLATHPLGRDFFADIAAVIAHADAGFDSGASLVLDPNSPNNVQGPWLVEIRVEFDNSLVLAGNKTLIAGHSFDNRILSMKYSSQSLSPMLVPMSSLCLLEAFLFIYHGGQAPTHKLAASSFE